MPEVTIIESIYYSLAIIGVIIGGVFGISKITVSIKKYVDSIVDTAAKELNSRLESLTKHTDNGFVRVDERFNAGIKTEQASMAEIRNDIAQLKAQVAIHTARFGMIEMLLNEMRGDIKLLLSKKD